MKVKKTGERDGTTYFTIVGTDIRVEKDTSTGKTTYCANFDECLPDEKDLYYSRYRYLGDYTEDVFYVNREIQHYMEWFVGYSRNKPYFKEVRDGYISVLDSIE